MAASSGATHSESVLIYFGPIGEIDVRPRSICTAFWVIGTTKFAFPTGLLRQVELQYSITPVVPAKARLVCVREHGRSDNPDGMLYLKFLLYGGALRALIDLTHRTVLATSTGSFSSAAMHKA
jgi:hypothetical protein